MPWCCICPSSQKKISVFYDQPFIHTIRGVGFIFKGNDQNVLKNKNTTCHFKYRCFSIDFMYILYLYMNHITYAEIDSKLYSVSKEIQ